MFYLFFHFYYFSLVLVCFSWAHWGASWRRWHIGWDWCVVKQPWENLNEDPSD